jgi:hypothetical protein
VCWKRHTVLMKKTPGVNEKGHQQLNWKRTASVRLVVRNKNKVPYNPKGNTCTCIIYLASKFVTAPPENEAIPFFKFFLQMWMM